MKCINTYKCFVSTYLVLTFLIIDNSPKLSNLGGACPVSLLRPSYRWGLLRGREYNCLLPLCTVGRKEGWNSTRDSPIPESCTLSSLDHTTSSFLLCAQQICVAPNAQEEQTQLNSIFSHPLAKTSNFIAENHISVLPHRCRYWKSQSLHSQ